MAFAVRKSWRYALHLVALLALAYCLSARGRFGHAYLSMLSSMAADAASAGHAYIRFWPLWNRFPYAALMRCAGSTRSATRAPTKALAPAASSGPLFHMLTEWQDSPYGDGLPASPAPRW